MGSKDIYNWLNVKIGAMQEVIEEKTVNWN